MPQKIDSLTVEIDARVYNRVDIRLRLVEALVRDGARIMNGVEFLAAVNRLEAVVLAPKEDAPSE